MGISDELFAVAEQLESKGTLLNDPQFMGPLDKLEAAANQISKSWSGSWFGYHSRVYYAGLQSPPPGAHFSQEWGLMDELIKYTTGNWEEYAFDEVVNVIFPIAENPDISTCRKTSAEVCEFFEEAH